MGRTATYEREYGAPTPTGVPATAQGRGGRPAERLLVLDACLRWATSCSRRHGDRATAGGRGRPVEAKKKAKRAPAGWVLGSGGARLGWQASMHFIDAGEGEPWGGGGRPGAA